MREVALFLCRELDQEADLPERSASICASDFHRTGPEWQTAERRKWSRRKKADEVSVRPEEPAEVQ